MKAHLRCLHVSKTASISRSAVFWLLVMLISLKLIQCSATTRKANHTFTNEIKENISISERSDPAFISTGNILWDNLIQDCLKRPTFSCIQKNAFSYLSDTLQLPFLNVTNGIQFIKNSNTFKLNDEALIRENRIDTDSLELEEEAESPFDEVSSAVSNKMLKFIMTHDMKLKMPEMVFDGAVFALSPRSIEGNGIIAKIEFLPSSLMEKEKATPRIFFKKIKKHVQKKLLLALVGIILIIKLIKIKFFWLLPMLIGATAAKKLALKILLFLFPALSHIFKLCSYYQSSYHKTNYHQHHHSVNHLHSVYPAAVEVDPIYAHSPSKGISGDIIHSPPVPSHSTHDYHGPDWEFSGPGLGSEYISDLQRISHSENFHPHQDDINEIKSWGLGGTALVDQPHHHNFLQTPSSQRYSVSRPYGKINHFGPFGPVHRTSAAESAIHQVTIKPNQDSSLLTESKRQQLAQQNDILRFQNEQKLISKQQQILQQQPFVHDSEVPHLVDAFYSPILERVDKIFASMNIAREVCKEKTICDMYKNPKLYSPYSNYISVELSRDASELQRPSDTNAAVIRFFKYIQAAREGQDQQDCKQLYSVCNL